MLHQFRNIPIHYEKFKKNTFFKNSDNINQIIFMISHHILIKYIIDRSILFQNNIDVKQEFLSDFQTNQKQI